MKRATVIGLLTISLMAAIFSGCGDDKKKEKPVTPVGKSRVVQGAVDGATVFADKLVGGTRFVKDNGEVSATTNANGNFNLKVPDGYGDYELISQGGTDTLFSRAAIQLRAPASARNVSPLTTLVAINPALQAKIELLGVAYDADIAAKVTPAALLLSKSVETVVTILTDGLNKAYGLTAAEKSSIQNIILGAIAVELAKPGTTTDTLINLVPLKALLNTAIVNAIGQIEAAFPFVITNSEQQIADIIVAVLDVVGAAIGPNNPFSTDPADSQSEDQFFDNADVLAINTAVNQAINLVAALFLNPDVTAPTIVSRTPACGATGVALDANITIVFSEAIDPATITTATIFLKKKENGELIPGVVTYNAATNTATFNPNNNLKPGTTYTVTVTTGVTDLAGNPLAVASICDFTATVLTGTGGGGGGGVDGGE